MPIDTNNILVIDGIPYAFKGWAARIRLNRNFLKANKITNLREYVSFRAQRQSFWTLKCFSEVDGSFLEIKAKDLLPRLSPVKIIRIKLYK